LRASLFKPASAIRQASADCPIELPSDLGLRSPHRAQHGRYVECGDLVNGTLEERSRIRRAKMTLPLVADLRVDGLTLRILDDEIGDLPEGRDRFGGLPGSSVGLDRVDPAGDELPRLGGPFSSVLESDRGIGAETLILPDAGVLVAQNPFFSPEVAHDEVKTVSVAVPARLRRLYSPFRKPRHCQSHIGSHTSKRIVAHGGQRKTSPRVSHRIR
jgi:hypothetical protein